MRHLLTLLATLTLAGAAQAAPQTSGLVAQRGEVVQLDARRAQLAGQRIGLERGLDRLATEISELKGEHQEGLSSRGLDRRLVRSRELSSQIDALRQREAGVSKQLSQKASELLNAYDAEINAKRTLLAEATETRRPALLAELGNFEQSRRELQAGLLRLSPEQSKLSDTRVRAAASLDPEALRAEADRLRDTRDRLRRRMKALVRRAKALRAQQELESEMRGFQAETSLFDESDYSVVRVTASPSSLGLAAGASNSSADAVPANDGLEAGTPSPASPAPGLGAPGGSAAFGGAQDTTTDRSASPNASAAARNDAEAFFRLDNTPSRTESLNSAAALLAAEDEGSPESLDARRAQMETLAKRLGGRADSLDRQASAVER